MDPLLSVELVLAVVMLVVVAAFSFVWGRRRFISGDGRPVMLCALRREHDTRWRLGLARLGSERFEWFSIVGPSLRPEVSWLRGEVQLGSPKPTSDVIPGLAEPVSVTGSAAGRTCEFAFVPAAYTAVRAWLESSPPGYNVNVA
ncbi:DUF2550 domain-containing protein [Phycicoccus sp. CSK15P-2]|uniref:DUF2550 family protein n=1 Tax=Phycicoccus sp. CSK15P-2 TaxID=2807627 RepID=UPI0019519414|nr:DUF2550 family protein [Phycicoccus sp. CSK15P-2]MBM6405480.1 DUF2550 domain-containing protein [Phycicoccus sp. CSK15P-2]